MGSVTRVSTVALTPSGKNHTDGNHPCDSYHQAIDLVARRRLERGVKLNHPEAVLLIADYVVKGAQDGILVAALMVSGAEVLSRDQVMLDVPEMIHGVQVEATFPDGTKLVTVHDPTR